MILRDYQRHAASRAFGVYEGMGAEPVLGGPCPAGTIGLAYPACVPAGGQQPSGAQPVLGGPCPEGTTGLAYPACVPNGMIPVTPVTPAPPNPNLQCIQYPGGPPCPQPSPPQPIQPPPAPKPDETNWLLYGGLGLGAIGLLALTVAAIRR